MLAPGWTEYTKRVPAQTYDVTSLVKQGENAIGAVLGDGWYAGRLQGGRKWGTAPGAARPVEDHVHRRHLHPRHHRRHVAGRPRRRAVDEHLRRRGL